VGNQERLSLIELIKGCVQQDRRSEERLYKSFYGYLAGVAFRYVREQGLIRELVNEAFVRIFKKIDSFKFDGPADEMERAFKGWIGKIAANAIIDRLRVQKSWLYLDEMSTENMPGTITEIADRLNYNDVLALLDRLPKVQQLIFNLYEIEGFSHDEIAGKLNMPASTSRVYLSRAKTTLMQCYQQITNTSYER